MLDTRITAVVALPTDSRLATQTVAEFYPRRSKPNLDKSDFAYNFIQIHGTLRMSPAMAAGVTDRLWSIEDLVALWESYEANQIAA